MHVTHELLVRATPVCIPFRSPWGSISVAKAEVSEKMKYFIWKTDFKKRFDWDGSFFDVEGEMLRITLNMLHDVGYLSFPDYWKPEDEDNGQPPAWFALKADADRHRAGAALSVHFSSRLLWPAQDPGRIAAADGRSLHPPRSFRERGAGAPSVNPLEVKT